MLSLLHIADSAFPTGAFGHSWGLEYAIESGSVSSAFELADFCSQAWRYSLLPMEGAFIRMAYGELSKANPQTETTPELELEKAVAGVFALNFSLCAMRPSLSFRMGQAQVGRSLLVSTGQCYAIPLVELAVQRMADKNDTDPDRPYLQFPLSWAICCYALGVSYRDCLATFLFSACRQWSQVAQRLVPIGQKDANIFLARAGKEIEITDLEFLCAAEPNSATPMLDIAAARQSQMAARYFRS